MPPIDEGAIRTASLPPSKPERTLIMGWNRRVPLIVRELDAYVAPGSEVVIVAEEAEVDSPLARPGAFANNVITIREGDTTDRATIDGLDVAGYDHIILLCSEALRAAVRRARAGHPAPPARPRRQDRQRLLIVSEMMDSGNRASPRSPARRLHRQARSW
jgi:hypothetical protein